MPVIRCRGPAGAREGADLAGSRRSRSRAAGRGAPAVTAAAPPPVSRLLALPSWAQHLLALALLALALGIVFPEIAWRRQVFAAPDYEAPSYLAAAGRRALANGEYPLWNPYIFLGMPSFGSLSFTPWVFPPAELLAWVGRLPFVPPLGWLLFYFAAAGFGVYFLLRSLGCGFWPAMAAAVCFMLTPHLVSMGVFGHGSKLASVAFLPWLLWATLRLRHGTRALATGILALLVGLLLLRGHPQIAFYALLMLANYAIVEVAAALRARLRGEALRFAACLGAAVVLGFGLAAVLLLPVRAYAPASIRGAAAGGGASYEYATGWSQAPSEMLTFLVPSAMGFGEGTYVGAMPFTNFPHYLGQGALLFGVAALLLLRGRLLAFLISVGLLALAVSFGHHAPLVYDLFYAHLPYFNKFRVPVMILVLLELVWALGAGLGLAALAGAAPGGLRRRRPAGAELPRAWLVTAGLAAALIALAVVPWSQALAGRVGEGEAIPATARAAYAEVARRLLRADGWRVAFLLLGAAGVVAAQARRKLPADAAGLLLVALTVFDLGVVDRRMVHPERTWPGVAPRIAAPADVEPRGGPLVHFLQEHADGPAPVRILPAGPMFASNEWMAHGIASVGGYHPAKLARFQPLLDDPNLLGSPAVLNRLAVRYIVSPQPFAAAPPVYSGADGAAYANPAALPRARLATRLRAASGAGCFEALRNADPSLQDEALVESAPPEVIPQATAGQARVIGFAANRVEVETTSAAPALLVLAEAYHPNWRARVDGKETPVLVADCILRGVVVPAGTARVVFEFVDPALRAGMVGTAGSGVVVTALCVWGCWRARRRGAARAQPRLGAPSGAEAGR